MEKATLKKAGNIAFWLVMAVMLFFIATNLYGRFVPHTVQKATQDSVIAPGFELKDLDGKKVRLADYKGKIVILNFWTTWCPYCVKEMPDLDAADKELSKSGDAVVIAVDLQEDEQKVRSYLKDKNIALRVLMDYDGKVGNIYGVESIPTTYIINRDGSFYGRIPGATSKENILKIVKQIK